MTVNSGLSIWVYSVLKFLSCFPKFKRQFSMKAILNVWASLVVHMVKNRPAVLETWIRSLGGDSLEKDMATHSRVLA